MRWAVVSDVHGNLHALRAVLDAARPLGVDDWVCAGDVVGYGAHPAACVELVDGLGAQWVAGNHELLVLGQLSTDQCSPLARDGVLWTQDALPDDVLTRLRSLPPRIDLPGLTVAHGSLEDPQEYVRSGARADVLLAQVPGQALVLGHTHQPWVRAAGRDLLRGRPGVTRVGASVLVNPGSVGQSRDASPDARFAIVDLALRRVELLAVPYDVHAAQADLVRAGLPAGSYHSRPSWKRRALSTAVSVVRREPSWS